MRFLLCLALSLAAFAIHAEPLPPLSAEVQAHVRQLRERAKSLRDQAEQSLQTKQSECAQRLLSLSNDCLDQAQGAYASSIEVAQALEDQAYDLEPISDDEARALKEQIQQLKQKSKTISADAERNFKIRQNDCYKKFLVNACIDEAREAQKAPQEEVKKLDRQVRGLERELKRRDKTTQDLRIRERQQQAEAEARRRQEQAK